MLFISSLVPFLPPSLPPSFPPSLPPRPYLRSSQDLVWAEKTLEELQARLSLRLGVEPELEQLDWSVSDNMFLRILVVIVIILLLLL